MKSIKCKIFSRQLQTARRDNVDRNFIFRRNCRDFKLIVYVIAESSVRDLEHYIIVALLIDCSSFIQEFRAYTESKCLPTL